MSEYRLVIATPFYEVKAYSPYIVGLSNVYKMLNSLGVDWDYYEISGDSYVDRAKNTLVHRFMESDYTHILMIDSDMYWDIEGFGRMLKASMLGCEVVGAAYPCKNVWKFFGCIPNIDKETGNYMGKEIPEHNIRLLDMHCIPGGLLIYSREAFERTKPVVSLYDDYVNNVTYYEYFKCHVVRSDWKLKSDATYMSMSKKLLIEEIKLAGSPGRGIRLGEDVYFQQQYRSVGGKVWLEPNITVKHMGITAWEGNYHEYLLNNIESKEVNPLTVPDYDGDGCPMPEEAKKCA